MASAGAIAGASGCSLDVVGLSGAPMCSKDMDCDDMNPCTDDRCLNGACQNTNSTSYIPDDHNECTVDSCKDKMPLNDAMAALGKKCGVKGTLACDGMGQCAGCKTDMDCQPSTDCQKWKCNTQSSVCEFTNIANAMPVMPDPTPDDCFQTNCDGNGGTVEVPLPVDHACNVNSGKFCDGKGVCLPCVQDSDCGPCHSCNAMAGGCQTRPAGATDQTCNGAQKTCDATGACKAGLGEACSQSSDCFNGACRLGICRKAIGDACTDRQDCVTNRCTGFKCTACLVTQDCFAAVCNNPGPAGTCAETYGDPCGSNSDCTPVINSCLGGLCRLPVGGLCSVGYSCESEYCSIVSGNCQPCSIDADCIGINPLSPKCVTVNGTKSCLIAKGQNCNPAFPTECSSGNCSGFPPRCQ